MRIVKVGVLAPTNKGIPLGVQGENSATQVEFDTRPWFREYPSGTVSAVARRDGDPAPYPLTLDVADGTAVWQVSDTDTAKAGEGAVELTMTSAGARVRSLTFKTLVTASLTDSPVDDDAWYGWLDKAVVKVDETVQSAQRKMAEVDDEWTGLKADVTAKVDECGKVAAQAAQDAHHAKVDAQATAKALESAEGSVAKAEAAANRAVNASIAADDRAAEASRSALSAGESADAAAGSAANAATSASEAATSASNAADAASAASGSASAAAQSATDASNAKAEAQTAKSAAETAKREAATSASNAATSATAAANSASDAAKTLTEAKQYTDANTSNALVGTASGKLLHVEDAWPGKPLGLTIDGAYKQDGTPSPEAPVPITVVRNMAFEIIGSNGVDLKSAYYRSVSGTKRPEFIDNGVVFNVTNNDERFLRFNAKFIAGTTVILTCDYEIESGTANRLAAYIESTKQYIKFGVPETITKDASYIDLYVDANETASIRITNIQLSYVNISNYRPYTSSTLPITLPSEHPYLAALPDGTHDEIAIDKYGNASLIARVGKSIIPETNLNVGDVLHKGNDGTSNRVVIFGNLNSMPYGKSLSGSCSMFVNGGNTQNRDTIRIGYDDRHVYLYTVDAKIIGDGSADAVNAWVRENQPIITYPLETPVTYPLGKLDIPSLPETISNAWIEATLTPEMSMMYKRDINIAFDNLVQAVVAAAAGE